MIPVVTHVLAWVITRLEQDISLKQKCYILAVICALEIA